MLKTLTFATISLVSFAFIAIKPVKAQEAINTPPYKLLKLARQGRFKAQGIPSYSRLNSAIKSGKVTAHSLVSAAIEQNRLPQIVLEDAKYLTALDNHLKSGGCGSL